MSEIILHHYPQSPVSEKVRVVLGIKNATWRSVIIPRLPPKPDLMPLTGGYRLTPVMQVGADVFCDSQCIIRAIDCLRPEPTLYPGGGHGLPWALARWADGPLFKLAISLVFGDQGDGLPADFSADRGPLYFGADYDIGDLVRRLPETLGQLAAQLAWIDERLAGRDFILGTQPGLPDALCYYIVWFVRGRYSDGPSFLSRFRSLEAWESRVREIGHGRSRDMSAADALAIAKAAAPDPAAGDPDDGFRDFGGFKAGDAVRVRPIDVGADVAVSGRVHRLTAQEISLARSDPRVGDVVVHFPRVGYRLEPA